LPDKPSLTSKGTKDSSKALARNSPQWSWWSSGTVASNAAEIREGDRIDASAWAKVAAPHELLGLAAIVRKDAQANPAAEVREDGDDAERLRLCIDAAITEAASAATSSGQGTKAASSRPRGTGWRTILRQVRRERLDDQLRVIHDELLIDALEEVGALDELQATLARIPPAEAGPQVWQALERCALGRVARLPQDRSGETFDTALRIWDEAMGLSWPKGSRFPGQLTERVAAMTRVDPGRRLALWQDQLRKTGERLEAERERFPHVGAIVAERTRVEAQRARR
jgi:hypothetical protein